MEKIKILIVDDEVSFLQLIQEKIASWGYEVIKASSGKEAIELLREHNPDMIVLDYAMPDMDGTETLKQVRKVNRRIPVIILTAHTEMDIQRQARKLGAEIFIPKQSVTEGVHLALQSAIELTSKKIKKE